MRRAGSESVGFAAPNAGGHLLELPSRRPPQRLAPRQSIAAPTRRRPRVLSCRRPRVRSRGRFHGRVAAAAALAAAALLVVAAPARGQYFGRNEVSWPRFHWQVLRTAHFDLDYYPVEESAVREQARIAELWYARLSALIGVAPRRRTSFIVYANQDDFRQTAPTPEPLGQGVGFMLEPVHGRVVLPLTGDAQENEHLLAHQLVHVFELELLRRQRRRQPLAVLAGRPSVPQWMSEGLAEYLSVGRESAMTAMWLRDALLRGDLPDLGMLSRHPRYLGYRWGHAFWAYVGGRWGDAAAVRLYVRATQVGAGAAIRQVLGLAPLELTRRWRAAIGTAYGAFLAARRGPAAGGRTGSGLGETGERLIPRRGEVHDENVAPSLSPDGSQVAFLSTRGLASFDLYLADVRTGEVRSRLLETGAEPRLAALRLVDAAGSWSPDGSRFATVVFGPAGSEIALIAADTGRLERRIGVPGAGALADPAWSPDGRRIALTGTNVGSSSLYLVDLEGGQVRPLTSAGHSDLQPAWSPDGRTLAFTSDRGGAASTGLDLAGPSGPDRGGAAPADRGRAPMRIWLLDVAAGGPPRPAMPLEPGGADQVGAQFGPGPGQLFFVSDRGGVSDVYRLELDGGRLFQVTRAATGVSGVTRLSPALAVAARSGRLAFSVFAGATFEIHSLDPAAAAGRPVGPGESADAARVDLGGPAAPAAVGAPPAAGSPPPAAVGLGGPAPPPAEGSERIVPYHPRLQLEAVSPGVDLAYSSLGYAIGGDVSALLSDAAERYQVRGSLQAQVTTFGELGGEAFFLDRGAPLQWGVDVGHVPAVAGFARVSELPATAAGPSTGAPRPPRLAIDQIFELVVQDQESLLLQYPFSSTRRLQASVSYSHLGFAAKDVRQVLAGSHVVDTSRFDLPAPPSLELVQGSLALIGDDSVAGYASPASGERYRFEAAATGANLHFAQVTADYRHYFFWRPWTLALRALHLGRYGSDADSPQLVPLYVGDPTLVRGYGTSTLSAAECTPTPASSSCPEFDRLTGSRLAVANLELRVPLFGRDDYRLVGLRFLPTELAAFLDAGTAWSSHSSPVLRFAIHSTERIPVASAGVAARVVVGGLAVVQLYVAKPIQRPQKDAVTGVVISPGW
jgi:Omp85 superfamily domain/WD40-like Beta Propeller Repeat